MNDLKRLWKIISHNFGLKLLAFGSAFLIWIAVANTQDPIDFVTFTNVPVSTINGEVFEKMDKEPEITNNGTITVTVEARKHIVDALTADDIIATADYKKYSAETLTAPIDVSVKGYDDSQVEITRGNKELIEFVLSEMTTKEFKVKVETTGTPAEGCVVGAAVSSPNMISVYGPKLAIGRIKSVVATIDVNGLSGEMTADIVPVLLDNNDEQISVSDAKLTLSAERVKVTAEVYKVKTVSLRASSDGIPSDGYEVSGVSFQPSAITVSGTDAELAILGDELRAYVDVTGEKQNVEKNIDIEMLIDGRCPSVHVIDDDSVLAVTVYVSEQKVAECPFSADDVVLLNLPDNLIVESKRLSTNRLSVRTAKDSKFSDVRTLLPEADLSGLTGKGSYEMAVSFNEYEGVKVLTWVTITVGVREIEPEPVNIPVETGEQGDTETDDAGSR